MAKNVENARILLGNDFLDYSDEMVVEIANSLEQLSYITYAIFIENQKKIKSHGKTVGLLPEMGV
jgi:hypothetical protein